MKIDKEMSDNKIAMIKIDKDMSDNKIEVNNKIESLLSIMNQDKIESNSKLDGIQELLTKISRRSV